MYSRTIGGRQPRTLSFGVSGLLWRGMLVLYDEETESLWSQMDGRCIQGELEGERLEHVDSVVTTWGAWRREHPDTLVLRKNTSDAMVTQSPYADYIADEWTAFTPDLERNLSGVAPKRRVHGFVVGGTAFAVADDALDADRELTLLVSGREVRLERDERLGVVRAWVVEDGETEPLPVLGALWYAWRAHHPRSFLLLR